MSFARPGLLLIVLATLLGALACSSLTEPSVDSEVASEPASAPTEAPPPARRERPLADAGAEAAPEMIGASHVLIKFKGADRAGEKVTRTKEEARKLAEDVLKRAKKGEDFAELAKQLSEDDGTKARGGHLPHFPKGGTFGNAAWELKPGQISEVVETRFGFHVIKRDP